MPWFCFCCIFYYFMFAYFLAVDQMKKKAPTERHEWTRVREKIEWMQATTILCDVNCIQVTCKSTDASASLTMAHPLTATTSTTFTIKYGEMWKQKTSLTTTSGENVHPFTSIWVELCQDETLLIQIHRSNEHSNSTHFDTVSHNSTIEIRISSSPKQK